MKPARTSLRRLTLTLAAGLILSIGACQDAPTVPDAAVSPERTELLTGVLDPLAPGGPDVTVLRRTEKLESDEVARARVGLLGATLHLRRAGLTVHVPAGAARVGTRIEVRAPAGDLVGYHFEPHGTRFALPVTLVQDLGGTEAEHEIVRPLLGAYFDGELSPIVRALEILPVELQGGAGGSAVLYVSHFSGYVVATN